MASLFSYISTLETQGGRRVEFSDHFYHGKPCKRCGGTARSVARGDCMTCKNRRREALTPINNPKFVEGKPCKYCGETLRYASTRQCVKCNRECTREKNKLRDLNKPEPRERYDQPCLQCGKYHNYFFLDYCHDCTKEVRRKQSRLTEGKRCLDCGEWKYYHFKDYCRKCVAAETKRREGQDYYKRLHYIATHPF